MVGRLMHDDAAVALAGAWLFCAVAFTVIVLRSVYRGRGENTPACDPAFDPALREDREVEALEFVWALPTREPQRW